ncbi:MAG: hypothetical protein ABJK25_11545 [Halieaceae bacterium]
MSKLGRSFLLWMLPVLSLLACVEQPAHQEAGERAQLRSWMKIISIDGVAPEDPYLLMLEPGQHRMEVLYQTYRQDYLCLFQFEVAGGSSYEVVDHSNLQPLVLYRWVRANVVWAERLDPVFPDCEATAADR